MKPAIVPGTDVNLDLRWTLALNRLGVHVPTQQLFRIVSRLGDGVFWYLLMAFLVATGTRTNLSAAVHMAATGLLCTLLYRAMKNRIRRPRPFRIHVGVIARIRPLDEFSFPSGHTLHAVNFSIVAIAYVPSLAWLLLPFTVLVAVSRVVLGMHYPSDVLAAIAIGSTIAGTSLLL